MGVKVIRPSGAKDWYIQVCEGGRRYLRHVGSKKAAHAAARKIEEELVIRSALASLEKFGIKIRITEEDECSM